MSAPPIAWTPRFTWEERLKYTLVPPRLYMWRLIRKHMRGNEPELRLLPFLVPRDRAAIDVGANRGIYTHVLAKLCTHVHAFEPNPKMLMLLRRALPRNATAYQAALSDTDGGTVDLIVPIYGDVFSNVGASLNPRMAERPHGLVQVERRTLDSYKFDNVGYIKIDVEGFEDAVLAGATETIMRNRPIVQVEMEEGHTGRPIQESHALMDRFDMDGFFVRGGELRPLAEFDAERDHRAKVRQPGYVNNFIFRPR